MNSDDVEVRTGQTAAGLEAEGTQADDDRAGRAYRSGRPPPSIYAAALPAMALAGVAAGFGASALSLAIFGLGVPFVAAALLAGMWAGLLIYALGRWALARAAADPLRTELRGALQPALMISDRLLKHDDPAVRRAGDAVVRSVQRATDLLD